MEIKTLGIDIGNRTFHLAGMDKKGNNDKYVSKNPTLISSAILPQKGFEHQVLSQPLL